MKNKTKPHLTSGKACLWIVSLFNPHKRSWFGKVGGSKHRETARAIADV